MEVWRRRRDSLFPICFLWAFVLESPFFTSNSSWIQFNICPTQKQPDCIPLASSVGNTGTRWLVTLLTGLDPFLCAWRYQVSWAEPPALSSDICVSASWALPLSFWVSVIQSWPFVPPALLSEVAASWHLWVPSLLFLWWTTLYQCTLPYIKFYLNNRCDFCFWVHPQWYSNSGKFHSFKNIYWMPLSFRNSN